MLRWKKVTATDDTTPDEEANEQDPANATMKMTTSRTTRRCRKHSKQRSRAPISSTIAIACFESVHRQTRSSRSFKDYHPGRASEDFCYTMLLRKCAFRSEM